MSATVSAPEGRRTPLSRAALITGGDRRTGLVVPSGEPVGAPLPELLRLLGARPAGPGARRPVTDDGTVRAPVVPLAAGGVVDGAELHLIQDPFMPGVRPDDGRAAEVAVPREMRSRRARSAVVTAGAASGPRGAVAGPGAGRRYGGGVSAALWPGVAGVLSGVAGAALAATRAARRATGAALSLPGCTLGTHTSRYAPPGGAPRLAGTAALRALRTTAPQPGPGCAAVRAESVAVVPLTPATAGAPGAYALPGNAF